MTPALTSSASRINAAARSALTHPHDDKDIVDEPVPQRFLRKPLTVNVIGACFSGGQPHSGVDMGPEMLVKHGLLRQLSELGWQLENEKPNFHKYDQYKDEPGMTDRVGRLKNARYVSRVAQSIFQSVQMSCSLGNLALTLGGDHSLAMGTVAGSCAVYKDVGVLWIDAHADINTPATTTSGNLHGCPVSFLLGLAGHVEGFEWLQPCLRPSRICYIGLRDVDQAEKRILRDHGIRAYSMHEVDRWGIGAVVDRALDYLGRSTPLHVSFDVDALDPSVAPATGTPVRGGLTFREGHYIMEAAYQTGCLVAVDLMEVNPTLGNHKAMTETVEIGCSLVRSALGE
ncbi:Arginase, catabolizes arginine to ornithine and urea, partial [Cladochytrium tenue]